VISRVPLSLERSALIRKVQGAIASLLAPYIGSEAVSPKKHGPFGTTTDRGLYRREIAARRTFQCDRRSRPNPPNGPAHSRCGRHTGSLTGAKNQPNAGGLHMPAIASLTRWKSSKHDEMVAAAKKAKPMFDKHGAEMFRVSRFHTGPFVGEWLVVTRYASWAAYAKAQEGLANDAEYQQLLKHVMSMAELTGRSLTVGIDL
jgi:hypothetical protein